MTSRKRKAADLTGIRQRGARFQVRIFGGIDPATGKQLILDRIGYLDLASHARGSRSVHGSACPDVGVDAAAQHCGMWQ
jgi:hypothetical protein